MVGDEKVLESSTEGNSRCDRGSLHETYTELTIMYKTDTC
jgi:hypothetical protein